jgi:uncharacterized integral membrane protein (TIGR00698 family)
MPNMNMKRGALLTEDYTAVLIAFSVMFMALAGFKPTFPSFAWNTSEDFLQTVTNADLWKNLAILWGFGYTCVLFAFFLTDQNISSKSVLGYSFIFVIVILSQTITGNASVKNYGLEVVLFSLLLGLFISNVLRVPAFVKPLIQTELFIKIGLVLLGAGIIFRDVLMAGSLGLIQSVIVVFTVWQFSFWVCRKFGIEDELRAMLSSAVAICGVSAAIATAGAIKGDGKKLSYVISLVLITAIPMMIFMPYIAQALHLPDEVAGAWLGGTIDTTGAVVAAGKIMGEKALLFATVVKFSQNVLLGLAAFIISLYWAYTKNETQERPSASTIWSRFPKFVLGFIASSLLFSFIISPETASAVKGTLKELQTFWFAMAFICIGLETKFEDIFKLDGGRPAFAFLIAQLFNIIFTLGVAWIIFGMFGSTAA